MTALFGFAIGLVVLAMILLPFVFIFLVVRSVIREESVHDPLINTKQASPSLPYNAKKYFFTQSEQVFFDILNAHIDAQRYTVFPKVRLGDFIEVDYNTATHRGWWARIRSRHVDYLIWDLVEKKLVLAIELDGYSHTYQSAQKVDAFKNQLFQVIDLPLKRVRVGTNFENEISQMVSEFMIVNQP